MGDPFASMLRELLLHSTVLPAGVAGVLALVPFLVGSSKPFARASAGAALVIGALAGYLVIAGVPAFPPIGAIDKLVYLTALAFLASCLPTLDRRLRLCLLAVLSAATVLWIGWPRLETGAASPWMAAALLAVAATAALDRLAESADRPQGTAMLALAGLALAPVAFYAASVSLASLAFAAFAATLAAGAVVGIAGDSGVGRVGLIAGGVLVAGLAAIVVFYTAGAPLAVVPLAAIAFSERLAGWRQDPSAAPTLGSVIVVGLVPVLASAVLALTLSGHAPVY